ncbi:MAG: leucine-rich repeat protein, partial [Christensenellaceae bacterium]
SHAFADCGNLKSVTIAPTETGIALGEYAFSGCKNLIRLEQENYFVSLGDSAFSGTGFTDFTIGSNVKEMGAYCFSGSAVRTVTIESEAITSLPYGCFLNSALERIDLGLVTEIDDYVFSGCGKLTDIDFTFIQSIGASSFSGTAVEKVENEYLTSVPANAFKDCPNLTEAKLFNVDTVEWYAFDGCENLSLFVSQPLVSVGVYGFAECNLSSVSFSSAQNVLVGNCGFYGNTSLTELHFSAGADIRYRAFSHCEKLHSVKVQGGAKIGEAAFDNCLEFENLEISGGATIETGAFSSPYFDLAAPKALTISGGAEIAEGAFENGTGLETLKIYGDANIGFEAFKNYSTLREVEIEGSVKMGEGAFSRCPELKTVKFSGDTVILADYAFESCPSLEKVEISASEGRISFTAFSGPTQTIEVYLNSGKDYEWEGRVAENIVLYVPKELMTYILEWWQVDEEQVVEYDFAAA